VLSTIAVDKDGNRYYDHNLTRIEKGKLLDLINSQAVAGESFGTTPGTNPTTLNGYKGRKLVSLLQTNSSKVVDENGEPRVVYHGTNNEFTAFNKDRIGEKTNNKGIFGNGFYFTKSEKLADEYWWKRYGTGSVMSVFLNVRAPFDWSDNSKGNIELAHRMGFPSSREKGGKLLPIVKDEQILQFTENMKEAGFDGVVYNYDDNVNEIVAFYPNQIKSATGNVGTFDVRNDDIRYQFAGESGAESRTSYETYKGEVAMQKLNAILKNPISRKLPATISSLADFKHIFAKPIRTAFNEVVNVKDEVFNKILRNSREEISGAVLPTLQDADFGIRDNDGSVLYIKRYKNDKSEHVYNVAVVNKHGELEDYISSVHIKNDNNILNKINNGAELLLPNERDTYGNKTQSNSAPAANVARKSESANDEDDILYRTVFGGNKGYVGYSKSKRATKAEVEGKRSVSNFDRAFVDNVNAILQSVGRKGITIAEAKRISKNANADEWHHTSMYGNKTSYYSPETIAYAAMDEAQKAAYDQKKDAEWEEEKRERDERNRREEEREANRRKAVEEEVANRSEIVPIRTGDIVGGYWVNLDGVHVRLDKSLKETARRYDEGVDKEEARRVATQYLGSLKAGVEKRASESAKLAKAREIAERLGLDNVEIVTDASQLEGKRAQSRGFYNRKTGKITIVLENNTDAADVERTMLHEAVAHYGLRKLFGGKFDTFLDNVYQSADASVRAKIDALAKKYKGDKRTATEEHLAGLAEDTDFENVKPSWWQRVKQLFKDMLRDLGFEGFADKGVSLSDNELRYLLWQSYENLKSGGAYSIFDEAASVVKQAQLGVGNFAETNESEAELERVNEEFNEQLGTLTEKNADNVVLSLGSPSEVLLSAGVEDKPMKLYGNKVMKKMRKHGFTLDELRDLPRAVANPIAVFDNLGREGNRSVLTELKTANGNFLVTIDLGKGSEDIDFNIVSSVFGKGKDNIVDWIERGYATYINKEKALNYLHHSALRAEALSSSRLSSAAKVVEEFENPKSPEEKKRDGARLFHLRFRFTLKNVVIL